jgi:hypothetical protein
MEVLAVGSLTFFVLAAGRTSKPAMALVAWLRNSPVEHHSLRPLRHAHILPLESDRPGPEPCRPNRHRGLVHLKQCVIAAEGVLFVFK